MTSLLKAKAMPNSFFIILVPSSQLKIAYLWQAILQISEMSILAQPILAQPILAQPNVSPNRQRPPCLVFSNMR